MENQEMKFVTIRQAAQAVGLSHALIRTWVKRNQVKGFYVGDRFYVNLPAFKAALEAGTVGDRPKRSGEDTENGSRS